MRPVWEYDSDGNLIHGSMRNVDLGECPFKKGDPVAQQNCSLSKPDPSWPQHSWTPFDMVKVNGEPAVSPLTAAGLGFLGGLLSGKHEEKQGPD